MSLNDIQPPNAQSDSGIDHAAARKGKRADGTRAFNANLPACLPTRGVPRLFQRRAFPPVERDGLGRCAVLFLCRRHPDLLELGRIAAELRLPVEILSSTLAIGALSGMAALLVMVAVSGRIRPLVTIGCCLLLGLLHWVGSGQHLRSGVLAHRPRQRLDLDPVAAAVHPAHAIQ